MKTYFSSRFWFYIFLFNAVLFWTHEVPKEKLFDALMMACCIFNMHIAEKNQEKQALEEQKKKEEKSE